MNVLYQNRPLHLWIGGDGIQLEKTMEAVSLKGVNTMFNDQPLIRPAIALKKFDIVHTYNFSMPWTKYQIWAAKNARKKAICTMIYHEGENFIPYAEQQVMLDSLDAMIFATEGEKDRVRRHLKMDESKAHVIPNGIDPWWFEPTDKKLENPVSPVLTVGRIEEFKGQLAVAQACKELGLRYVCIGESTDNGLVQKLKDLGAEVIGPQSHEDLKVWYNRCLLYVLASKAEVMPLTVMEAGSQGKHIVLTDHCEWKIPGTEYVEHGNVEMIKEAIITQINKSVLNNELLDLLRTMTWDKIADQHIKLYESVLKG